MYSWQRFKTLDRVKSLPLQEQARQYFLHQSNFLSESAFVPSSSAAAGAGAGGGGNNIRLSPFRSFYLDDGRLYRISYNRRKTDSLLTDDNIGPFLGVTCFAINYDDGFLYYVTSEFETSIFGKVDVNTGETFEIDTENLSSIDSSSPASLYYEGDGNFILMTSVFFADIDNPPSVIRINVNGTAELLSTWAGDGPVRPTTLFKYNDEVWCTFSIVIGGAALSGMSRYNINTSELYGDQEFLSISNVPNIEFSKGSFTLSTCVYDGEVYANIFGYDKGLEGPPFICLFKINMENFEADYLADLFTEGAPFANIVAY